MTKYCRVCLEKIKKKINCFELCGDEKSELILNQFYFCIPEINFNMLKNPVICTTCTSILHLAYNFKRKCLNIDFSIKNMLNDAEASSEWTLVDVLPRTSISDMNSSKFSESEDECQDIADDYEDLDIEDNKLDVWNDICNSERDICIDIHKQHEVLVKKEFGNVNDESFNHENDESENQEQVQTKQLTASSNEMLQCKEFNDNQGAVKLLTETNNEMLQPEWFTYKNEEAPDLVIQTEPLTVSDNKMLQPILQLERLPDYILQCKNICLTDPSLTVQSDETVSSSKIVKWKEVIKQKVSPINKILLNNSVKRNMLIEKKIYKCNINPFMKNECVKRNILTEKDTSNCNKNQYNVVSPSVTDKRIFKCNCCDFFSDYKHCFHRHLREHTKKVILTCYHCGHRTLSRKTLIKHVKSHRRSKYYANKTIKLKLEDKVPLDKTINKIIKENVALDETLFSCDLCSYKGKSQQLLRRHKKRHAKKFFKPRKNNCISKNANNINGVADMDMYFKCDYCKYKTKSQGLIDVHMKLHNKMKKIEKKPFVCNKCNFSTTKKGALKYHKGKHKIRQPYGCIVCDYTTQYRGNFLKHMKRHKLGSNKTAHHKLKKYHFVTSSQGEQNDCLT